MVDEVAKANVLVVCGVAVRDDKVLLIRSRRHGVATPGGKVKPGESPEEALRREMLEETGMSVTRVVSLLGSETANGFEVRTYHVRVVGELAAGDDATEAWWGDPAEVRDSPIPRDYPWILRAMEDERKVKARRDAWDAYREEMWNFATYRAKITGGQPAWLAYLALGLCGEASELEAATSDQDGLEEMADVIWYYGAIERESGIAGAWPEPQHDGRATQKVDRPEGGAGKLGGAIGRLVTGVSVALWRHQLLASACRVAECLKRPIVGRKVDPVRLQKSLDDCAAAIHALAEQHGGLTNVMERSTRKIRGEFGGAPWSAELMRERDDARGVTATAVEPSAAKDGDAP